MKTQQIVENWDIGSLVHTFSGSVVSRYNVSSNSLMSQFHHTHFTLPQNSLSHSSSSSRSHQSDFSASPSATHSPLRDLMKVRKDILHSLWTDIDEAWSSREDFIHLHFRESEQQNYKPISSETMRVFEIRWLDLRIQGLIEQREDVLRRLKKFVSSQSSTLTAAGEMMFDSSSEKNARSRNGSNTNTPTSEANTTQQTNSTQKQPLSSSKYQALFQNKDRESFLKHMTEELQIYRTLTLYITEYILTWCEKQQNKSTYYWNPESSSILDSDDFNSHSYLRASRSRTLFGESIDYINKMATDFVKLVRKSRRLQQILADLQLTVSPLCLPKYPRLYYEYDKNNTFEMGDFAKMPSEDFMASAAQKLESSLASAGGQRKQRKNSTQNNHASPSLDSARRAQLDVRVPSPNPYYNVDGEQQTASRKSHIAPKSSEAPSKPTQFFITETNQTSPPPTLHASDDDDMEPEIQFEQPSDSKPPINIHSLQQYLELPSLLVYQNYQDRQKRYKRYSEPLLSVRHEDLLREATMNEFGAESAALSGSIPNFGTSGRTGRKPKHNKYTDQILNRKRSPNKKLSSGGALKLSSKRTHTFTKNSRRSRNARPKETQIEFKPPNHPKELDRCQQAQDRLILHYHQERRNGRRNGGY